MNTTTKLIFEGVKFYWRTRNTIDVTIVDHVALNLTEVILYDPSLDKEAPRIYFSSSILFLKLDHDDIEYQLSFAKRNCVPITEKFIDGIVNKAKSDFILSRLVISEYSIEQKLVVVTFYLSGVDCDNGDLICEKPEAFQPFKTVHYQQLMAGVVDLAIQELNAEKEKLHTECDKAVELEKIAETSTRKLSCRERWRIPIVFVKISNGKRLNAPDTKIWSAVSQNMKTEEDATRMSAVLTRPRRQHHTGISPAPSAAPSRNVSFSGNHHVITPRGPGGAVQSKLHEATAATRHRTQATHGTASGTNSRQNSIRKLDIGATEDLSVTLKAVSRDEAGDSTSSPAKKMSTCKTSKSQKRPAAKNTGAKSVHKPLLGRLRKLSMSRASSKAPQDGSASVADELAAEPDDGNGDVAADQEADEELSTLQRMIAGLGAINNSLRSSFLSTLSGKSMTTANSGKTGGASITLSDANKRLPIGADNTSGTGTVDHTSSEGGAAVLVTAIEQAAASAALVPVYAPVQVPALTIPAAQKPQPLTVPAPDLQKRSFFGSFGAPSTPTSFSGPAHTVPATGPTSSGTDTSTGNSTTAAEFTIHKFFAGLVHWRSGNKIYTDAGAAAGGEE